MSSPSPGTALGLRSSIQVEVFDDEPIVQFNNDSFWGGENDKAVTLLVTRDRGLNAAVTVDFTTLDGSARSGSDYAPTSGTLFFAPGETARPITIALLDDTDAELPETFQVLLDRPTGGSALGFPSSATVTIQDDVEIGAGSTIDRARTGATRIGRGTKIDNQVQIGHNCDIGEHCIIVSQSGVSGSCTLGKYVMLGGQVGLADHLTLGDGVRVTAKSGLMNDFPAGTIVGGYPAAEWRQRLRELSFLSKFPELKEQLRDLLRRIERLESAADHRS